MVMVTSEVENSFKVCFLTLRYISHRLMTVHLIFISPQLGNSLPLIIRFSSFTEGLTDHIVFLILCENKKDKLRFIYRYTITTAAHITNIIVRV